MKIKYRPLGRTGIKVSELCLGCMNFGKRTGEKDSISVIHRAIEEGVNFLDTANVYGRGSSESTVGKALEGHRRDRVVLASKVHGRMRDDDPNGLGNHRRHIIEQCEASLQRLGTDWIDLYQIHRPDASIPIDETLRALDDLIRAGKVRYVGTSTFAAWQVVDALWCAKELGLNRFICEQPPYNLLDRRAERELIPCARTYGAAIIPWSPLAGGFLTGKYGRDSIPENSRLSPKGNRGSFLFSESAFAVLDVVRELAEEKGCTASQLSLAWCKEQPGVTSPIMGPRTMEQLEDNLGAVDVEITDSDRSKLDEAAAPGRATVPYYEADFGPHSHPW